MSSDTSLFWLIHFFIGIVLPAMIFLNCCQDKEDTKSKTQQAAPSHRKIW